MREDLTSACSDARCWCVWARFFNRFKAFLPLRHPHMLSFHDFYHVSSPRPYCSCQAYRTVTIRLT